MTNDVAKLLKDHREKHKWSLEIASKRTGLEQSYIYRVETGSRKPARLDTLKKFAKGYRISLAKLMSLVSA